MKIDNALRDFYEKYDKEALASIDALSQDRSLILSEAQFDAQDISKQLEEMAWYIKQYAAYKTKHADGSGSSREEIMEATDDFIKDTILVDTTIPYSQSANFVRTYMTEVTNVINKINDAKSSMIEAECIQEDVGDINIIADNIFTHIQESFDSTMSYLLLSSGYTTKKTFASLGKNKKTSEKPIFL